MSVVLTAILAVILIPIMAAMFSSYKELVYFPSNEEVLVSFDYCVGDTKRTHCQYFSTTTSNTEIDNYGRLLAEELISEIENGDNLPFSMSWKKVY